MAIQLIATKLYKPISHADVVLRSRLIARLNKGSRSKVTLISAPAGFGKTTLVTEWIAGSGRQVAWLSLDQSDSDPARFFTYFVAALQTIAPNIGKAIFDVLQSPDQPPIDSLLTDLLNQIVTIAHDFVLVLDDYHALDSQEIDAALTFLIENQPPQMHLAITTREDPQLPLARLRGRGQLTEVRAADLRFTPDEAAEFLNRVMGLSLSSSDIAALEARTEGWIAGLQLAALSMQGHQEVTQFIDSFTGSHHFVSDYLVQEVLNSQPSHIQRFLLQTSILERICGPLCDAVLQDEHHAAQQILESIQEANLFLVPLDNERRWYRYHHLFGDLLRKRLRQSAHVDVDALHSRASRWFEENGFEIEAFQHAAAAHDLDRAMRLIEADGTPLYLRGAVDPVLHWLESLPHETLDSRPTLWVMYAWILWITHRSLQVEDKLQRAEALLPGVALDDLTKDTLGKVAAMRAMLAANEYRTETMIEQSQRALDLLHADNDTVRLSVKRTLASAHHIQGNRVEAIRAYEETIALCEASHNVFTNILASTGLGMVQALQTNLIEADRTFHHVLELVGASPKPVACEAYLGLARIHYEWNDLRVAEDYGQLALQMGRQIEGIDTAVAGQLFLAQLALTRGDIGSANHRIAEVTRVSHQRQYAAQTPNIAACQVRILLHQADVHAAAALLQQHDLPLSAARVDMVQGQATAALEVLTSYRQEVEARSWRDEGLKAMVLQALAYQQHADLDTAVAVLGEALTLAAPERYVRTFIDEGEPMRALLAEASSRGIMPNYAQELLTALEATTSSLIPPSSQPLIEPLSERELEILALIAEGLSNREISQRLFITLSTVKGHNGNIFGKLQVKRRTEAVARARELDLI